MLYTLCISQCVVIKQFVLLQSNKINMKVDLYFICEGPETLAQKLVKVTPKGLLQWQRKNQFYLGLVHLLQVVLRGHV